MTKIGSKGFAQTVNGKIKKSQLGFTLMHEHIFCDLRKPEKRSDVLYTNDQNLQDQVDLASSILQTLEDNLNANISLQNQVDNMQNQINTLSIAIQQLQELIIEE